MTVQAHPFAGPKAPSLMSVRQEQTKITNVGSESGMDAQSRYIDCDVATMHCKHMGRARLLSLNKLHTRYGVFQKIPVLCFLSIAGVKQAVRRKQRF